jgi:DNA-binding GntR family transcriptional regulator
MARPSLAPQMTARIIEHIRERDLKRGDHLPAQVLADALKVSRAPISAALQRLEAMQIVRAEPNRGYFLVKAAHEIKGVPAALAAEKEPEDELYFRVAEDRLAGRLPDRVSESELMRIYDLPRARLLKVLYKIADEGWLERLPGNGWLFTRTLTSRESYEEGYEFRAAIESQAVLLPSFKVDKRAFENAREEQKSILDGGYKRMSRTHLFESNSQFHEMLVGCSGNEFFLDAVRRVNRLRRLLEYRITVDRERLPRQCREHLRLLTLLESGDRQEAAKFLKTHILGASAIKTPLLA